MHELQKSDRRQRVKISTIIFVFCSLLSSARLVIDTPTLGSLKDPASDVARDSDRRFAALRAALPVYGVVGYIGEPVPALADYRYYLTQYALAPLVVDHSTNHALVVGNFQVSQLPGAPSDHLRLVKDFGSGVLLFANKDYE